MTSKCSIKPINLRPLPWPATKPHHDPMMWGESVASMHRAEKPIPTFAAETVKSQTIAKARARAAGKAEKRHDIVARLAREGMSDEEIAEQTGYKPDSVRRLIGKMRKEGVSIPLRQRGRKKCSRQ